MILGTDVFSVLGNESRLPEKSISSHWIEYLKDFNYETNNFTVRGLEGEGGRRNKFKSLIIESDFEPENPKQLEELDESVCKWPIGHPNESTFYFCGRKSLKDFSYCKLHLLYAFQPKGKKDDLVDKEDEVPKFIEKKIKSA